MNQAQLSDALLRSDADSDPVIKKLLLVPSLRHEDDWAIIGDYMCISTEATAKELVEFGQRNAGPNTEVSVMKPICRRHEIEVPGALAEILPGVVNGDRAVIYDDGAEGYRTNPLVVFSRNVDSYSPGGLGPYLLLNVDVEPREAEARWYVYREFCNSPEGRLILGFSGHPWLGRLHPKDEQLPVPDQITCIPQAA